MPKASYHHGQTIKEYRKIKNWTQAQLAEHWPRMDGEMGVNVRYVQDVEYGDKRISDPEALRKLSELLSIPLWKFGLSEYDPFHPTSSQLPLQGIMEPQQNLGEQGMDQDQSRRNFLRLLGVGTGFIASQNFPPLSLGISSQEKLLPTLSEASIHDLNSITHYFRMIQRRGDLPLLDGIMTHLSTIQQILSTTTDNKQQRELWRILAQTQLLARLYPFPKQDLPKAKFLNELAITSARNSGDTVLMGAAIGHLAHFYLRVDQNPDKASQLLDQAQEYIRESDALFGWFSILRASIASLKKDRKQSEKFIFAAMETAQTQSSTDLYFTDFSVTSVHFFAGNCWLTVGAPKEAYELLTTGNFRELAPNRHPSAYYDIARAYVASDQLEAAQTYALKSIDCAFSTSNLYIIPRFISLARTIQQKYPDSTYATTISEYALHTLYP
jgi:transcriptional regulator with XRE-family HTH domain